MTITPPEVGASIPAQVPPEIVYQFDPDSRKYRILLTRLFS
jgi:hypothetical protein